MTRQEKAFKEIEQMYGITLSEREKMLMTVYYTQYKLTIEEEREAEVGCEILLNNKTY